MILNDIPFSCTVADIITELQSQLHMNGINLLQKIIDTPDNIMVCCPYHKDGQERKPSAGIRKTDGTFHCFTCGEVHALQEVISYCFGYCDDLVGSFGWKWLTKNFLMLEVENRALIPLNLSRNKRNSVNSKITSLDEKNVTESELERFRYIHPYMYKRKLTDEVIELFDVGYDKQTDSLTFPVRDINGNCLFIVSRSVKGKRFMIPKGVEKPLYGIYELYQSIEIEKQDIIVCESIIDALTCWVYGKYAVALNGLGTELQFEQLRKLPCRKLIIATDNDTAGLKARERIKKNVRNKILTQYVFPENRKDINDLSKEEFENLEEIFL